MRRVSACAAALLLLLAGAVQAGVRASLDNAQIGLGETVQLTLARDGQTNSQPDLAPLKQDFDVLSVSRSSNVQIVNGTMSSQVQAQIELSPKHAGQLTVPPIAWDGETTAPLTLTVSAAASGGKSSPGAAAGGQVFLTTAVDNKTPYVQAAVDVTISVFASEQIVQGSLNFPGGSDVLMQQDGGDRHSTVQRDGQQYDVIERHYLLFPQKSGEVRVPGAVLDGQIPVRLRDDSVSSDPFADFFGAANGMMTGTKPIRVHGDDIVLNVRPRPADAGTGTWLPAQSVKLTSQFHPESLRVHAGDPITLDLHLQAVGLTAAQLPDLASMLSLPAAIKAYPDQAKLQNVVGGGTVTGNRDQSIALIADHAGRFTVPALHLSWWDIKTDQRRGADLPAQSLDVLPAAAGAIAPPTPAAALQSSSAAPSPPPPGLRGLFGGEQPWIIVSAALGALWLATMLAWWVSRARKSSVAQPAAASTNAGVAAARSGVLGPGGSAVSPAPQPSSARADAKAAALAATQVPGQVRAAAPRAARADAARARRQFHEACRRNEAPAARRWLLAWAAAAWPAPAPTGLAALAKRCADPQLDMHLAALDRACYAGDAWDGAALADALKELPPGAAQEKTRGADIEPLYP